jgi:hypothetical protein
MSSAGICSLVAEYYIVHPDWPRAKAQLEEQLKRMLNKERSQLSAEEFMVGAGFLDRFTVLEFRKRGDNLVFRYRFKVERKTTEQMVTFKSRPAADEILGALTLTGGH